VFALSFDHQVCEGLPVWATIVNGGFTGEFRVERLIVSLILSEAFLLGWVFLEPLVHLTKDCVLSVVVAFALILESLGFEPVNRKIDAASLWEGLDLFVDELGFHAAEETALDHLDQMECRAWNRLQKLGVVWQDLEELGVQHPVEHHLLLQGLLAELFECLMLCLIKLKVGDLEIGFNLDVLDLLILDEKGYLLVNLS
jgi:hypothetical protein